MVSGSININTDLTTVWNQIVEEFCKAFKCETAELTKKTIRHETKSSSGNQITVMQNISEFIVEESIAVQSVYNDDLSTSRYTLKMVNENTTIITLTLDSTNNSSAFKYWNFKLMSLPVLRTGMKRKLQRQLIQLKQIIEKEGA